MLNIKFFFFLLFEKLEKDVFVILLFFIDLFTIFELITILVVNYSNHILLMTHSGAIQIISFSQNHNFIIRIWWWSGIRRKVFKSGKNFLAYGSILTGIFLVWMPHRIVGFIHLVGMKYWFMWLWFWKVYHRTCTMLFRIIVWTLHFLSLQTYL